MNTNTHPCEQDDFNESISHIGLAHSVRAARLDFLGPIGLVCVLGCVARLIQSFLAS